MKSYFRRVSQNYGFPHFPVFPSVKSIGLSAENCYEIHKPRETTFFVAKRIELYYYGQSFD